MDERGLAGILHDTIKDEGSGLWLSSSFTSHAGLAVDDNASAYEIRPDANRGVAGVVYLLGRLARLDMTTPETREQVQRAVQWLLRQPSTAERNLPGLHFGRAGIAMAMVEALSGGLIERTSELDAFMADALAGPLDWPGLTHGAAGQGVAKLGVTRGSQCSPQ